MHNNVRTIAIVDDHTMFRKGLVHLINLFPGHQVLFDVSNGKQCIEQLSVSELPNIVLMDITMPEMDGYQTTEWLSSNYPSVKVLALSTMDAESAIIRMIKSGAKGYVLKDADPIELKTAFDSVLTLGYYYNDLVSRKVLKAVNEIVGAPGPFSIITKLTPREIEFLKLSCTELSYKEIADKMFLSPKTIEGYRDSLCQKLNVKGRLGLVLYALKNEIVTRNEL